MPEATADIGTSYRPVSPGSLSISPQPIGVDRGVNLPEELMEALSYVEEQVQKKETIGRQRASHADSTQADLEMRMAGAGVQQSVLRFVLANYPYQIGTDKDRAIRSTLRGQLGVFWDRYRREVVRPLERTGHFASIEEEGTGMHYVLVAKQGLKGAIATALMARAAGWEVEIPEKVVDVRKGIDLKVKKNGRMVNLQIKCETGAKFSISEERFIPNTYRVVIPAEGDEGSFYLDRELGVPHTSYPERFDTYLSNQIAKKHAA